MKIKTVLASKILLGVMILSTVLLACKKDQNPDRDPSITLHFSTDTILFDTVFTSLGSTTQELMIYNNADAPVEISKIYVANDEGNQFSINVDGVASNEVENIRIEANDSAYLFAKVTINPTDETNPFIVESDVVFETNGNQQQVKMVAYGQNAHYITPKFPEEDPWYALVSGEWIDDMPYVVYGIAVVDSLETLIIREGCRIYFHQGGRLWVYNSGTLKVNGLPDSVVTFTNDRLEPFYSQLAGQWDGLHFGQGSVDNELHNVVIRNAVLGIQCDFFGTSPNPTLTISNVEIHNMSIGGVAGNATSIVAQNMVVSNCIEYAISLNGGQYDFRQVTVGNYPTASRSNPSFILANYYLMTQEDGSVAKVVVDPTAAFIGNTILYGSVEDELFIDNAEEGSDFEYLFQNTLIRSSLPISEDEHFVNLQLNEKPLFIIDYQLDSLSPARRKGVDLGVPYDIIGTPRPADTPDLGAYQMEYGDK